MPVDGEWPTHSCRCLNVRIRPLPATHSPPVATDSEFSSVHVGDEGITVIHPQVTLRIRSRGVPIGATPRCARYTSVTCLICETLVYRVHQIVPINVEGKDGPQFPTDDWVEQEIMKSPDGWIEVHEHCLTGDAIPQAAASSHYSDIFCVVLYPDPLPQPSPTTSEPILPPPPSPSRSSSPPASPRSFLSTLRPLFPPPPFTSTHPTFVHFSKLASDESQKLRAVAEEDLSKVVADKVTLVQQSEDRLVRQVETIWRKFRQGITNVERDSAKQSTVRTKAENNWTVVDAAGNQATPVSIRDFVPVQIPPARAASVDTPPRMSSLSASLVSSSFHYPKELRDRNPSPSVTSDEGSHPPPYSSSPDPVALSSPSGSISNAEGGNLLEPFKRSMDPVKDTTASFKYFTNLEADIARAREERGQDANNLSRGRSEATKDANGRKEHHSPSSHQHPVRGDDEVSEGSRGQDDGSKGKRKVTFDVKPDVVNIDMETNAEKVESAVVVKTGEGELIFDLEEEGSERSSLESPSKPAPPAVAESTPGRPRRIRADKVIGNAGLPDSLVALRPASLPLPSHVHPPRGNSGLATSRRAPLQPARDDRRKSRPQQQVGEDTRPLDGREVEILRLVAASTPSHRGAWKRDSKAWQLFIRRNDGRTNYSGIIPEETEDEDGVTFHMGILQDDKEDDSDSNDAAFKLPVVGSLPIPINPVARPKEALSLASYQPKTTVPAADLFPSQSLSSTALRKAAYAERDRTRAIDPGALDFAAEEDADDESDEEDSQRDFADVGERGRRRALKILQALADLPEPGMWRSLV